MTADRPDRFFHTTLLGGFLHVRGIRDWGPWRTAASSTRKSRLWMPSCGPGTRDRKVRTQRNCRRRWPNPAALGRPGTLWLYASLLEETRRLWEIMSAELTQGMKDFASRDAKRERSERLFLRHKTLLLEEASHFLHEHAGDRIAESIQVFMREVSDHGAG